MVAFYFSGKNTCLEGSVNILVEITIYISQVREFLASAWIFKTGKE